VTKPADTPTKAEIRRGRLNVELFRLEADAMVEHSTPRRVIGEMMSAAAGVAMDSGMDVQDFIKLFGAVLCHLVGGSVTMSVVVSADEVGPSGDDGEDDD
jgi:hypothetical protein